MRSVERSLSGGLSLKKGVSSQSLKTFGWDEEIDGMTGIKLDNASTATIDFARSGVVAAGK